MCRVFLLGWVFEVYLCLFEEVVINYDWVKFVLMKSYDFIEDGYWWKFRVFKLEVDENCE